MRPSSPLRPTRFEGIEWTLGEPDGIQIKTVSDWSYNGDEWQLDDYEIEDILEKGKHINATKLLTHYEYKCLWIDAKVGAITAALFRMRDEIIQQAMDFKHEPDNLEL